jgi:hypothetical protein
MSDVGHGFEMPLEGIVRQGQLPGAFGGNQGWKGYSLEP